MPTNASQVLGCQKLEPYMDPDQARQWDMKIPALTILPRGTIMGQITALPGTYNAYNQNNSDGTQVPTTILAYDISTDAAGLITLTNLAGQPGAALIPPLLVVGGYYIGTFRTEDCVGWDSVILGALNSWARLIQGTSIKGIFRIG